MTRAPDPACRRDHRRRHAGRRPAEAAQGLRPRRPVEHGGQGEGLAARLPGQAEPATRDLFKHLRKDGKWLERDDVWVKFLDRKGKLTVGLRLARTASARSWGSAPSSATTTPSRCCSSRPRGAAGACTATSARRAPGCRRPTVLDKMLADLEEAEAGRDARRRQEAVRGVVPGDARRGERDARRPQDALPGPTPARGTSWPGSSGSRAGTT